MVEDCAEAAADIAHTHAAMTADWMTGTHRRFVEQIVMAVRSWAIAHRLSRAPSI
jgi:hypothetical protein